MLGNVEFENKDGPIRCKNKTAGSLTGRFASRTRRGVVVLAGPRMRA